MAERTLPGLGLTAYWNLGADGWKPAMDVNLRLLSAAVQLRAISRTTSLPGGPSQGDVYIIPVGDTDAGKVAIYDDSAWVLLTPAQGWFGYVVDTGTHVYFTGTQWAAFAGVTPEPASIDYDGGSQAANVQEALDYLFANIGGGGGGSSALTVSTKTDSYTAVGADANDGYVRMNKATALNFLIPSQATAGWSVGDTLTIEQTGAGVVTIAASESAVTINSRGALTDTAGQFAVATLVCTAADEWTLTGDLA